MEYELLIEEDRVNEVVREYEELHPPVFEPCPICLEDINLNSSAEAYSPFSCCNNFVCKDCCDNNMHTGKVRNCPLCRVPIPVFQEGYNQRLIKCVKEKYVLQVVFSILFTESIPKKPSDNNSLCVENQNGHNTNWQESMKQGK